MRRLGGGRSTSFPAYSYPVMLTGYARLFLALALLGGCAAEDAIDDEELGSTESEVSAAPSTVVPGATTPGAMLSAHTTLGFPEEATATDPEHALVVHTQWVASYDSLKKNPRWTSWELTKSWLGNVDRTDRWIKDGALSFTQAADSDYSGSGYQRGHICPSADRTRTTTDNQNTFLFTNVVPQTAESNTAVWAGLENQERTLARTNHVFITVGQIYEGAPKSIGRGVRVPSSMFKVIVVMQGAHPLPSEVTESTRVIAVEIPNTHSVSGSWTRYKTSLDAIERKTGFKLLSDVDPDVHDALATKIDSP
jgi:endonuclease G